MFNKLVSMERSTCDRSSHLYLHEEANAKVRTLTPQLVPLPRNHLTSREHISFSSTTSTASSMSHEHSLNSVSQLLGSQRILGAPRLATPNATCDHSKNISTEIILNIHGSPTDAEFEHVSAGHRGEFQLGTCDYVGADRPLRITSKDEFIATRKLLLQIRSSTLKSST